ncbi:MAG: hypothetical protein IKP88_05810 [Lachnospiraceae bacterium]|nr:hypothetical protein [Lachnospiraceae bacterium]
MTQAEMNVVTSRLFSIGKEIFEKDAIKDSIIINNERLMVDGDFTAEPFKVHVKLSIYAENGLLTLFSVLPFDVPQNKGTEFARLLCELNYNDLYAGNYDYNIERGKVVFRMAIPFRNSIISKDLIEESIMYCVTTVSKYNDRLFKLASN